MPTRSRTTRTRPPGGTPSTALPRAPAGVIDHSGEEPARRRAPHGTGRGIDAVPQRITNVHHDWQGAACITLTDQQARTAEARLSIRLPDGSGGDVRIAVIEVYCADCGGVFEDWYDEDTRVIAGCVANPGTVTNGPHAWVGSALVPLDDEQARHAVVRHAVTLPGRLHFDVIETYCGACRRPYADVAERACEAAESNDHLRGGPIGERKRRVHDEDDAERLAEAR
jgi:hypothetical protein